MKEINISTIKNNVFDCIAKDWGVVTVQADDKVNGMTVSWVQMGHLWNKNVVTIYVRPQRHTHQFIEQEETFSLAFFDEQYRKQIAYLGRVSGKDEDKLSECGFTTQNTGATPYIEQASLVFVCKKLYTTVLKKEEFYDSTVFEICYPKEDFHTVIIAEITKVLSK